MKIKVLALSIAVGLGVSGIASALETPALGTGNILTAKGKHQSSTAVFNGGITVNDQSSQKQVSQVLSDAVAVTGTVQVQADHLGQTADVVVYAAYKYNPTDNEVLFTLGKNGADLSIQAWDGKIENLATFQKDVVLESKLDVSMYKGQFLALGNLDIFFGYRLKKADGSVTLVRNATPIKVRINAAASKGSSETPTTETPPTNATATPLTPTNPIASLKNYAPKPNGFKFENYSNDTESASDLKADDLIRLFGRENVCRTAEGDCVLTAAAEEWAKRQIKGMDGGHCEGMAVMSLQLFNGNIDFKGKKLPSDFQAGTQNSFDLEKSAARNGIAYYFVTQGLNPTAAATSAIRVSNKPSGILQTLIDAMNSGVADNNYTLGIYKPGMKDGHAITPYAVEDKGNGMFWVYVYDNNYPNENRMVKINKTQETWLYEGAATNPNEPPSDYKGDANTKTLDLTPMSLRNVKFECPFCNTNEGTRAAANTKTLEFSFSGEGKILIINNEGKKVGFDFDADKEVNEIVGSNATPVKNGLGKDIPPSYELPVPSDNQSFFTVAVSGKSLSRDTDGDLLITGPGFTIGFAGIYLDPSEVLFIQVRADGKQLSFSSTQEGEAPEMFMALDPKDSTTNNTPAYRFDITTASGTLSADKVVSYKVDDNFLYVMNEDDSEDSYVLDVTRIDNAGKSTKEGKGLTVTNNAAARIKYSDWASPLTMQTDNDGKGFDNKPAVPLQ